MHPVPRAVVEATGTSASGFPMATQTKTGAFDVGAMGRVGSDPTRSTDWDDQPTSWVTTPAQEATMTTQLKTNNPTVPRQRALPVYVSIGEAAEAMSVSTKTIRRRITTGEIPAYRFGRRNLRIRVEDLEAATQRVPTVRH